MASVPPETECNATLVIDPWTASIASEAVKRGNLQAPAAAEAGTVSSTTASAFSASTTTAQPRKQPATSHASSVASKFNLPHADVLHLLRMCYYNGARHMHKASEIAIEQSPPLPEDPAEGGQMGEAREAKRHKAAADATPQSRCAMALKRLCSALGVFTQHRHLPAHHLSYAVASSRGWRVAMEDTYAAEVPLHEPYGVSLFALYDGHGGAEVARYSALHMGRAIREAPSARTAFTTEHVTEPMTTTTTTATKTTTTSTITTTAATTAGSNRGNGDDMTKTTDQYAAGPQCSGPSAPKDGGVPGPRQGDGSDGGGGGGGDSPRRRHAALREAFLSLDSQLADEAHAWELMSLANPGALAVQPEAYGRRTPDGPYLGPPAGSTASVALVGRRGITVAGVGDSRCILGSRAGGVMVMSLDHKGNDAAEQERVVRAGCWVSASGRVCGELDMSRALGDADMKQAAGLPPHLQAVTADPTVMHVQLAPDPHHQPTHTHPVGSTPPDLPAPGPPLCGGAGGDGGHGGPGHEAPHGSGSSSYGAEDLTDPRDVSGGSGGLCQAGGEAGEDPGEAGPSAGLAGNSRPCNEDIAAVGSGNRGGGGGGGGSASQSVGAGQGDGTVDPGGARKGGGNNSGCYLLLASDGLWNVMDTEAVHEFVMERLEAGLEANTICAQLCVEACVSERTAYDNVTVLLVQVHGVQPVGEVHVATSTTHIEAVATTYGTAVTGYSAAEDEDQVIVEVEVGQVEEEQRWDGAVGAAAQAQVGGDDVEMSEPDGSRMGCVTARECDVRVAARDGQPSSQIGDATCSIWIPKAVGGSCSVGTMFGMGSKGGGESELAGRNAMAGFDEELLEPSPMQQDGRIR